MMIQKDSMTMKRSGLWSGACLVGLIGLALGGCSSGSSSSGGNSAIQLQIGTTVGRSVFPAGSTRAGGTGQTVDNVGCDGGSEAYHIHAHLSLIVNGEQIAIPKGIGIPDGTAVGTSISGGSCIYALHTHDETGIVHVEAASPAQYTLGQLFDIWGEPLTSSTVATYTGTVTAYVDGSVFQGDIRNIVLTSRGQITLVIGNIPSTIPNYAFPSGF